MSAFDEPFLRSLDRRLARLYHDLNNPLSIASGNLQLLAELIRLGEREGLAQAAEDTATALGRLEPLMAELLEIRRSVSERIASEADSA